MGPPCIRSGFLGISRGLHGFDSHRIGGTGNVDRALVGGRRRGKHLGQMIAHG